MVFPQHEFVNVNTNYMTEKTTLYTRGRYGVSHQYELLNVSARLENLQYELSYVRTN